MAMMLLGKLCLQVLVEAPESMEDQTTANCHRFVIWRLPNAYLFAKVAAQQPKSGAANGSLSARVTEVPLIHAWNWTTRPDSPLTGSWYALPHYITSCSPTARKPEFGSSRAAPMTASGEDD